MLIYLWVYIFLLIALQGERRFCRVEWWNILFKKRHQYKELGKKHPFPLSTWQTLLDESISYLTVSRLFTGLSP